MSSKQLLAGWLLSALAMLILLADAYNMVFAPERLAQAMQAAGFSQAQLPLMASILVVGGLTYLAPPTALLGTIIFTGFLGGAICAHVRIGEPASSHIFVCLAIGVLVWSGLALREPTIGRRLVGARTPAS
jgi:hypothetical protein